MSARRPQGADTLGSSAIGTAAIDLVGFALFINGARYSGNLRPDSINISQSLNERGTLTLQLVDADNDIDLTIGHPVVLLFNGAPQFKGSVDNLTEIFPEDGTAKIWTVEVVDFAQAADRYLIAREFIETSAGNIIKSILNTEMAEEDISTSGIEDGPVVTKAIFSYEKASRAFDELSEITGYVWYIDFDRVFHFEVPGSMDAPVTLTDAAAPVRRCAKRRTREYYRNKQFVRAGNDITDEQVETQLGDGEKRTFVMPFPLAEEPTVKVNAVSKTIGIRAGDTTSQWFWQKGEREITQNQSDTPLADTDELEVTFRGLFPIIVQAFDEDEKEFRAGIESGGGLYEALLTDEKIDKRQLALDRAEGLLRRYGEIPTIITFETEQEGFLPGQLIGINLTKEGINDSFLVDTVSMQDLNLGDRRYIVRCLSGEHLGSWAAFFKKLLQAGNRIVIRENEILSLLRKDKEDVLLSATESTSEALEDIADDDWTDAIILDGTEATQISVLGEIGTLNISKRI